MLDVIFIARCPVPDCPEHGKPYEQIVSRATLYQMFDPDGSGLSAGRVGTHSRRLLPAESHATGPPPKSIASASPGRPSPTYCAAT
jgi:hypothetical protein